MKKQVIILSLFCLNLSITNAQKNVLGFRSSENILKNEKTFDAQLSATRVGENIKLLSSVPHHVGSVGGKMVASEIAKVFTLFSN